jgi:SPP1 gp7 family putative phage head morphogenesis protein
LAFKGDEQLIDDLYNNGTGGIDDRLLQRYAGGFDKAVVNVFGAGRKYPELEQQLRINAGRFGTYKTHDLCRQLDAARQSGMAKDEFQKFAQARLGVYNAHQRTEYNTLTARSRTAKQWERFAEEKFLYPNIEWLQTGSANPRPEHLAFVGLILPQDDPFWGRNQPGNEYNCKCDWRTTDKPASGGRTPDDIPSAKGLEGNPAETGELVTARHPYFARNAHAPGWIEDKALLQLPNDVAFVERTTPTGKAYREHLLVDKTNEAAGNREVAALLLDNGYKNVRLLPKIHAKEVTLRERYFGKEYVKLHPTSNPDAAIDGKFVEFKKTNVKQITHNIGKAAKQTESTVLIHITEPVQEHYLSKKIEKQWTLPDRQNINKIIVFSDGKIQTFTRK